MSITTDESGPSRLVEPVEREHINPEYARRTADALPKQFKARLLDGAVAAWRGNAERASQLLGEQRMNRLGKTGLVLEVAIALGEGSGRGRGRRRAEPKDESWEPQVRARTETEDALRKDPALWMDMLLFWLRAQPEHVLHAAAALADLGHEVRSGEPCLSAVELPQDDTEEVVSRVVANHGLIQEEARLAVDLVRFGLVRFNASGDSPEGAATSKAARNPTWERDELILALELYFDIPFSTVGADHPKVIALSELLNALPVHPQHSETFRNPNGVAMKLSNFAGLDPERTKDGKTGLTGSGARDQDVWNEFAGNHQLLKSVAASIRIACALPEVTAPAIPDEDEEEFAEGRVLYRLHRSRERNKKVVEEAKKAAMKKHGELKCAVCHFDFVVVYGDLGLGYIEAHHMVALSELDVGKKTKVSDLALVCANCHRMLHRRRPWLAVAQLKTLLCA